MFHKDFFSSPSSQGLALGLLVRGFRLGLFRYTKSPRLGLPRAHRQPVQCLPRGVITRVLPFSGLLSSRRRRPRHGVLTHALLLRRPRNRRQLLREVLQVLDPEVFGEPGLVYVLGLRLLAKCIFRSPQRSENYTLPSRTLPSLLPSASFQDLLSALHCVVTDSKLSLQIQQVILPLGCAEYAPKSTPR